MLITPELHHRHTIATQSPHNSINIRCRFRFSVNAAFDPNVLKMVFRSSRRFKCLYEGFAKFGGTKASLVSDVESH